jgi:hypothetical protein
MDPELTHKCGDIQELQFLPFRARIYLSLAELWGKMWGLRWVPAWGGWG